MWAFISLHLDKFIFAVGAAGQPCDKAQVGGGNLFGLLPHWWQYMETFKWDTLGQCVPAVQFPSSLLPVGIAILDMLLRIAGFAAVVAIMISGVTYIFAQGNPEKSASARRALYNALVGLAIAFTATLFVAFVGNNLTQK